MKNQVIKMLKKTFYHISILSVGSLLGLLTLLFVFCIPTEPIANHIKQSISMLEYEFGESELIKGYPTTLTGNFTDCLMLEYAVYDSHKHSLLEQVLFMYRGESSEGDGWAPGISLIDYVSGKEQVRELEYSRYWHGYLVFLKPMLYFMNFNVIRMLSAFIQFFLVCGIVMLLMQRGEKKLGIAFLMALPFLYYPFLHFSLSLSICFYLLATAIIVQLKWNEKIIGRQCYNIYFLVVGMMTAYFDFLTYPLVTLGFPLCVYLYLNVETWKSGVKQLIHYSLEWWFGYIGIWMMKWIFTDILVGGNTIADAFITITSRTDNAAGQSKLSGFCLVVQKNMDAFTNPAIFLIVLVMLGKILYCLILQKKIIPWTKRLKIAGIILGVGFYPLLWFFFIQNHSEEHWMFTCKIMAISAFSLECAVAKFFD